MNERSRLGMGAIGVVGLCLVCGCPAWLPVAYEAVPPPAEGEPGRWIWLEGASNTRDIGGYSACEGQSVKWGTVYRSATLSHVEPAGCETFRHLGIRYVIDMRNRLSPSVLFDGDVACIQEAATVFLHRVVPTNTADSQRWYLDTLLANSESYRRNFEMLADANNLPILYHCAAGKDRTGIMTALLLTLLGVDRDTVIQDYRLSEYISSPLDLEALEYLLDEVDAGGGIEAFLVSLGVSLDIQTAIRKNLLE